MSDDTPEIFIDEGWKNQVEREKELLEVVPPKEDAEAEFTLFEELVSTLSAQTLFALGLMVQEGQAQVTVDLDAAKHMIDTLMMLRDKTANNLSPEESTNLEQAISELQRVFAARIQQAQQAGADIDPSAPDV
ncbi:MAG: DUF1844 domain-containing protein [Candidatus Hydrogenedentes bacterium]|nr:DUF1844 domain-containing protein [Candidatus Hydrogenedentota bacterium]